MTMTRPYDDLKQGPQTGVDRGQLTPKERQELRKISVTGTPGHAKDNTPGTYTDVYYLVGDEEAAVKRFIEENKKLLELVDFSKKKNALLTSVSRELYDLILHEMGLRQITKFETVVLETRPDGTQWLIDRRKYEDHPNRRYTSTESGSVKIPPEISLTEIFNNFNNIISKENLSEISVEGDVRQILDYFRVASDYPCVPTTTEDGQLAVKKTPS